MHQLPRSLARVLAPFLLVAVLGSLSGCGGDDGSSAATTSVPSSTDADAGGATGSGDATTTTEAPPATAPVSDDDFAEVVSGLETKVESAGDDPCKLLDIFTGSTPVPANAEQAKAAVDLFADLVRRIAESPDAPPAAAETLKQAAEKLPSEAAAVGYEPSKIGTLPSVAGSEFGNALATVNAASRCIG